MENSLTEIYNLADKILDDENLNNADIRVLLGLMCFNAKGKAFPKIKTLADKIKRTSLSGISKSLNKLEKLGYIDITHRNGRSSIYTLKGIKPVNKQYITENTYKQSNSYNNTGENINKPNKFIHKLYHPKYFPKCW